MGLAASQARYLFISTRVNEVEAGLLTVSAKEMKLADKADDISEQYNFALNRTHLQFNNQSSIFTYDALMGEQAMNGENGIYLLTTNDDKQNVVLNTTYANAAKAAGVKPEGNTPTSQAGQIAFLNSAAGAPQKSKNWEEVITGKSSDVSSYKAIDAFKAEFGEIAPPQGKDLSKPIYGNVTKTQTISDIISKMGSTGNFSNISNLDGKSTKGSQTINEQTNVNGTFANLVQGQGYVCLVDDKEDLSYEQIWSRAQKGFTNLANNIVSKIASASGIQNLAATLQSDIQQMANGINGNVGQSKHHSERKARNGGRDAAMGGLIGVAVDKTGTDQVWVYCNASELTRRLLTATANKVNSQGASNPAARTNLQNGTTNLSTNSQVSYVASEVVDYKPNTNTQGKTYEEWTSEWNAISAKLDQAKADEYLKNGFIAVTVDPADKTRAANYTTLYNEICSKGWIVDDSIGNKSSDKEEMKSYRNLAEKLENLTYKVNGKILKNSDDFQKVKSNDAEQARVDHERALNDLNKEEKKLEISKTQLQTELTALTTEEASVKSMIDKNVERSFSLWS